jgi:hypothetical protein
MKEQTASRAPALAVFLLLALVVSMWYAMYHPPLGSISAERAAGAAEIKAKIIMDNCSSDRMTMFHSEMMGQWLEICQHEEGWFARLTGRMANGAIKTIKVWKENSTYPLEQFKTMVYRLKFVDIAGPKLWP